MRPFFLLFLSLFIFASESTLLFKNGDIITGKTIELNKDIVILKYLGKDLSIKLNNLKSIKVTPRLIKNLERAKENIFSIDKQQKIIPKKNSKLYFPSLRERQNKKKKYYNSTEFNLGFNNSTGNKQSFGGYFKIKTKINNYYNTFTADINSSYTETEDIVTTDQSNLNFKISHRVQNNFYTDYELRFFRDSVNNLNLRSTTALGISYKQIKGLDIGIGISYIDENLLIDTNNEQYFASELTVNYSKKLTDNKKLYFENRFTFSSENSQDILYKGKVDLNIPFNSRTSTKFTIETNWDNTPSVGNRSTQILYHFSISYKL